MTSQPKCRCGDTCSNNHGAEILLSWQKDKGYMKAHFHVKLQDQDAENRPYLVVGWGYLLFGLFCALTSTACDRN